MLARMHIGPCCAHLSGNCHRGEGTSRSNASDSGAIICTMLQGIATLGTLEYGSSKIWKILELTIVLFGIS